MLTYKYMKRNAFGKYCRDCTNYLFNLNIERKDYLYYHGQHKCEYCGNLRHIVSGVKKGKHHKIWWGTKPVYVDDGKDK